MIGKSKLFIEVAKTKTEKEKGLSYRQTLANNHGMVFDFTNQQPQLYGFWMKEMRFPLDFIWVRNYTVIGITSNVSIPTSNSELTHYFPPSPVDIVIEVNAGWTEKNHIQIGDQVHSNLF